MPAGLVNREGKQRLQLDMTHQCDKDVMLTKFPAASCCANALVSACDVNSVSTHVLAQCLKAYTGFLRSAYISDGLCTYLHRRCSQLLLLSWLL